MIAQPSAAGRPHAASEPGRRHGTSLRRHAESRLPTRLGSFRVIVYRAGDGAEHLAIIAGAPSGDDVVARVHSECWTGEVLGSLRCDCREQLEAALAAMAGEARGGVLVYLRQEGRGIGLGNKILAYALQDEGADTVEANERLGFPADLRRYDAAAEILVDLGIRSVALMTNNLEKLEALEAAGIGISRRIPHWVVENDHNRRYLAVKRERLRHIE
jgi:3,4-dihydroxy 2-butanone 4-phosphate synthase/GTP cyclohydrolase II